MNAKYLGLPRSLPDYSRFNELLLTHDTSGSRFEFYFIPDYLVYFGLDLRVVIADSLI